MAEKIKITKSEVIQMIKEEYNKKKTEITLKKRLNEVNSKINTILKESGLQEETIEEVEVSGEEKVRSTAWTGEEGGDTKFKPKFDIKGTHKLEEEEEDVEETLGDEIGGEEAAMEIGGEETMEIGEESEDIEEILRKLADAIEEKVEDVVDEKLGGGEEEAGEEAAEEIGNAIEDAAGEEGIAQEAEIETSKEVGTQEAVLENAEEPQGGHSPATDENKDAPEEKTPFTEKQNTISEDNKKPVEKAILSEEMKRMQVMAGIRKPEDIL